MTVLIRDQGFVPEDWHGGFTALEDLEHALDAPLALDLPNDVDIARLAPLLPRLHLIRIAFPVFSDGRGFTLARLLRLAGYRGRLRAHGALLADQYTMLRRAGFDEVEIPETLALRQPEQQWLARADWRGHNYQRRLRQNDRL